VSPIVRRHAAELGVNLATVHGTGKDGAITHRDVDRAGAARPPQSRRPRVSPRARRLAAEGGLDVADLAGTGPQGAIIGRDVETARKPARPPRAGAASRDRSATMRAAIARAMARSKREIPHYYLAHDVDLTAAQAFLLDHNAAVPVTERVLPAALLLKATALAVRAAPELNGFWIDDQLRVSEAVHLGVAISLREGGLVAPAIQDADQRSLRQLMAALRDLVNRARAGSLRASELSAPTITVTSLGDQGVQLVHGAIYPPQVALVGFGAVLERPWAAQGMLGVRPVVTVTLAADHRASDGVRGARLLRRIDSLLQEPHDL
jgi:pyruvate dehydrogenase E2 component (dihydrolipoamide acetyltransferase)